MALAFPFGTVVQYIVIAFFGYVLIGAPSLSSILGGSSDSTSTGRSEKFGYETKTEIRRGSVGHVEIGRNGEVKEVQSCPDHGYKTHIFHRDPLVIYIEDFVSKKEMDHIIDIRYVGSTFLPFFLLFFLRHV
jgi:prolyl 4-hydroxylase